MRADSRERVLGSKLRAWFADHARELPWRTARAGSRDPYVVLVSEIMLQQTQAARVAERLPVFLARFPTLAALASASEEDVVGAWAGLGYYRRARQLRAAAGAVMSDHGGRVPRDVAGLRSLPGVGAYTAGAIASLAHGQAEPLVDGNVTRVLLRVEGRPGATGESSSVRFAWERARAMVKADPAHAPALNEALMELGALVCTPTAPRCPSCPWRDACVARARGLQGEIPSPKVRPERSRVRLSTAHVRDESGRVLVERAPAEALWGGLWRLPTLPGEQGAELLDSLGVEEGGTFVGEITRTLTHRRVTLALWSGRAGEGDVATGVAGPPRRWVSSEELEGLGMSSAYRAVLGLVTGRGSPPPLPPPRTRRRRRDSRRD